MGTNHVYESADGGDTQWDLIQRRLGNYAPKEAKWTPEKYKPEEEKKKDESWLDEKDRDELGDLEDDFADDRFLEEYRRKRMSELASRSGKAEFGTVTHIRGTDFVQEVTKAGQDVKVVVLLFKNRHERSEKLLSCLEEVAPQFATTKFVKIVATECIPGYPDHNVPTVLYYENTNCKENIVGVSQFGGDRMTPESVADGLQQVGAIERKAQGAAQGGVDTRVAALSSDDEDSDFD
ncbi:hypothetical protein BSKO_07100 [Bryopsis sp. KO-2023]|nr:hypothetical protein BSKO_07100 [Bryopsis sp. KO-2023]